MAVVPKFTFQLPWLHIWATVLLAGNLYMLGQYLRAGESERSIQLQYDLMKQQQQEIREGVRRSLEREGLHTDSGKKN